MVDNLRMTHFIQPDTTSNDKSFHERYMDMVNAGIIPKPTNPMNFVKYLPNGKTNYRSKR